MLLRLIGTIIFIYFIISFLIFFIIYFGNYVFSLENKETNEIIYIDDNKDRIKYCILASALWIFTLKIDKGE